MRQGPQKFLTGSALDSRVAQFGRLSTIRSVQTGILTIANNGGSGTATITTVDVNNSMLVFHGFTQNSSGTAPGSIFSRMTLTNSTTITAVRVGSTGATYITYTVIEFWPGTIRRVQTGYVSLNTVASNTVTVSAVDINKSFVLYLGVATNDADVAVTGQHFAKIVLTNATTLTATIDIAQSTTEVSYMLVEFY
jgi:hypothetical protein